MNNTDTSYDATKYNKRLMNNVIRMPLEIAEAKGATIIEAGTGRVMLDFWGDEGVASLGYASEEFKGAMQEFLDKGIPQRLPDVYPNEIRWKCAEIICDRTGMDRIFFACTGTEANEAAIKLARKYWWDKEGGIAEHATNPVDPALVFTARRHKILTIAGNFHGRTGYSMAAGDFRVSPYHRHGFGPGAKGFGVITDTDFKQVVTDCIEHDAREPKWNEVAAVILAPVLGNNCVHTYSKEFWSGLENLRKQHGFLLIYDDVQAGNGRAGNFATWQGVGVKPDIMSLAKGMSMGLPMSCMLASEEVAASFTPGVHFNTFGGTLLNCWLATRYYEWLDKNLDECNKKGEFIRKSFTEMNWIVHHDGSGMLNAFTPNYDGYDAYQFIAKARELGLSLVTHRPSGPIRFTPPMNISKEDLSRALKILDQTHGVLALKRDVRNIEQQMSSSR